MTSTASKQPSGLGSSRSHLRTAALAWLCSRAVVGVAYVVSGFGWFNSFAVDETHRANGLALWDGTWYRDLVSFGYDNMDADAQRFFPLFHLLGRALERIVGNAAVSLAIVANIAAFVAIWAMGRLVAATGASERIVCRSMWWLALFPAAATMTFAYSESLSIALGIAAVWSLVERRWWIGALAGLGAGLTRSVGALLCVALAAVVAEQLWRAWRTRSEETSVGELLAQRWAELAKASVVVVSPAIGFALYMGWLRAHFGSWDVPVESQRHYRNGWRDPVTRLFEGVWDILRLDGTDIFNVVFAVVVLAALAVSFRRVPWWASAYVAATLVVSLSANNINSLGRYVFAAFPLALVIAVAEDRVSERFGGPTAERVVPVAASAMSALAMVVYCLWAWSGRMIP